jgi:hypothetical protein
MTAANGFTVVDPSDHQKIVGATFAKHDHLPLVVIGDRSWNRWQLGRIGCPHPVAAMRVNRVIKTLGIKTVREFLDRASEFGRFKDLGVTSYWTVLALAADCGRSIEEVHGEEQSFYAMHKAALKALESTKGRTIRRPRRPRY